MLLTLDPLAAIGDPALFSLQNAKRAEKERNQALGATDDLNIFEKERLKQLITEELKRYKLQVDAKYPEQILVTND